MLFSASLAQTRFFPCSKLRRREACCSKAYDVSLTKQGPLSFPNVITTVSTQVKTLKRAPEKDTARDSEGENFRRDILRSSMAQDRGSFVRTCGEDAKLSEVSEK